jgi:ferredoxin
VGKDAAMIDVSFLQPDGTTKVVQAKVGETLLQTAHRYDIELEGACEGK